MKYLDMPLKDLHLALVNKEVTPLELTLEALKRAHESQDNAFELIDDKGAIAFASSLIEPETDNPLWGIPYVAKDNFSTAGLTTTASSNILNGYVPMFDATVIKKLKDAKAVLIGKTTLDELAMGGTGTTGHLGTTFNPYDPSHKRLIGGSSCGSAAACASGIVPIALGSDTGDSVRRPASYAGLVGFKPTWGRISRYGLFPFAPSLDHVGYFTRDTYSSAVTLNVLAGRDLHDATSSTREEEHYEEDIEKPVSGIKVAVIKEIFDCLMDEEVKNHFEKSILSLKEMGVVVDFVSMDKDLLESIYATYMVISCAEATSNDANLDGIKFGPYQGGSTYQEVMFNARNKGFSELIKRRFVIGSYCLMKENQEELFLRAQRNRAKIVSKTNEILSIYDFVYLPTAPSVAPLINSTSDKLSDEYLMADSHLILGNFAGLPSITIPLFFKEGLPVGACFMGRAFEEKKLFQVSNALEKATGLDGVSTTNRKESNL